MLSGIFGTNPCLLAYKNLIKEELCGCYEYHKIDIAEKTCRSCSDVATLCWKACQSTAQEAQKTRDACLLTQNTKALLTQNTKIMDTRIKVGLVVLIALSAAFLVKEYLASQSSKKVHV